MWLSLDFCGKKDTAPLSSLPRDMFSKDDGKGNGNDFREQWFDWLNEEK